MQSPSGELFYQLLHSRDLQQPDGRALHRYRFTKADHEQVAAFLRTAGSSAGFDRHGAALTVAHIAEWYRRDRDGGHWDWIRPLNFIGWRYGQYYGATLHYSDLAEIVDRGLRVWQRPQPASGNRLFAVVAESGFPAAAVRDDPRIANWLRKSVLAVERGFSPPDAVRSESWRVADSIASALHRSAEELVGAVVELRRLLPSDVDTADGDPIATLDRLTPEWRTELPFEIETEDVRTMIETMVRVRATRSDALTTVRRLSRSTENWSATIEIGLSGLLDLRRLPPTCTAALTGLDRVRVVPRTPPTDGRAIAAVERVIDDEQVASWELRPFVARFAPSLALEDECRLCFLSGEQIIGEFVPFGGEGVDAPVVAFEIEELDGEGQPEVLRLLGPSSARTTKPRLVLAIDPFALPSVSFSNEHAELGACGRRKLFVFSGTATFTAEGARITWRTDAEQEEVARMVLVGDAFHGVREHVFRGMPQVWIERDGRTSAASQPSIRWRAIGDGTWQSVGQGEPFGRIQIASTRDGEIMHQTGAAVVPTGLVFRTDRKDRSLIIDGAADATVGAVASTPLKVCSSHGRTTIDLSPLPPGGTLQLAFRWRSELTVHLTDPLLERAVLTPSGRTMPQRSSLAIGQLQGYRIVAGAGERICLEVVAPDANPICLFRTIHGEAPLTSLTDDVVRLIGGSDRIDSEVRVTWLGSNEHAVRIRWYAEAVDPFMAPVSGAFAALSSLVPLELKAFSLVSPTAGVVSDLKRSAASSMIDRLTNELGTGPWVIYGQSSSGGSIRPRILVPPESRSLSTPLARAIGAQDATARNATLDGLLSAPIDLVQEDRRLLVDLVSTCRRESVPYSALDILDALARCPAAAVVGLLYCETLEERSAVLDLQREQPFLWCATCIKDWQTATEGRLMFLRERLSAAQLPPEMAERTLLKALAEILTLRPDLRVHVMAIALMLVAADASLLGDEAARRILKSTPGQLGTYIARFLEQQDEATVPRGLFDDETLGAVRDSWKAYDPAFASLLAAPTIVAKHAAGVQTFPASVIRRCRDAWVFDPIFFEDAVPLELQRFGAARDTSSIE